MESFKNVTSALIKAKASFQKIEKDKVVKTNSGKVMYRYANLDQIIDKTQPALSKHGLCMFQLISGDNSLLKVTTILSHESGEYIESTVSFQGSPRPQDAGGSITYYKRYSYCSMLGISSDEDTDANEISGESSPIKKDFKAPTDKQKNMLNQLFKRFDYRPQGQALVKLKNMDIKAMSELIQFISENEELPEFLGA